MFAEVPEVIETVSLHNLEKRKIKQIPRTTKQLPENLDKVMNFGHPAAVRKKTEQGIGRPFEVLLIFSSAGPSAALPGQ